MIALDGWDKRGEHLTRYLADGVEDELQMGAVSGLADIQSDQAADNLIERLPHLSARNQKLAVAGLVRTEQRALSLLNAAADGQLSIDLLDKPALLEHPSAGVRVEAERLFKN